MSSATNRTERLAKALKDARPDFTLHNARVFSRAVIEAPEAVFAEKPLTFLPSATDLKDVTDSATRTEPAADSAIPVHPAHARAGDIVTIDGVSAIYMGSGTALTADGSVEPLGGASPASFHASAPTAPLSWEANVSLRALAEEVQRRLPEAEARFASAEAEYQACENAGREEQRAQHGGRRVEHQDELHRVRRAAHYALERAKRSAADAESYGGGPRPGYMMYSSDGTIYLGLVVSGGQVIVPPDAGGQAVVNLADAILELAAKYGQERCGADAIRFVNPLARGADRLRLQLVRDLQRVCSGIDSDSDLGAVELWKLLSPDFREARGIFDMSALLHYIETEGNASMSPGRQLFFWFSEDSMRAVAAANGL